MLNRFKPESGPATKNRSSRMMRIAFLAASLTVGLSGCSGDREVTAELNAVAATQRVEFQADRIDGFVNMIELPDGYLRNTISTRKQLIEDRTSTCSTDNPYYAEDEARQDAIDKGFKPEELRVSGVRRYTESEMSTDLDGNVTWTNDYCMEVYYQHLARWLTGKYVNGRVDLQVCENLIWRSEFGFDQVPSNLQCVDTGRTKKAAKAEEIGSLGAKTYERSSDHFYAKVNFTDANGKKSVGRQAEVTRSEFGELSTMLEEHDLGRRQITIVLDREGAIKDLRLDKPGSDSN